MANCSFCKKKIGVFGQENKILMESSYVFCDECFRPISGPLRKLVNTSVEIFDEGYQEFQHTMSSITLSEEIRKVVDEEVSRLHMFKTQGAQHGRYDDASVYSGSFEQSDQDLPYIVLQVSLKEKFIGTGSANLDDLQYVLNDYFKKGYRLHTVSTSNGGSKGALGGDRIQATVIFEKIGLFS